MTNKEKAHQVLIEHYGCKDLEDLKSCFLRNIESETMIVESMLKFAELACIEQKKICAENANLNRELEDSGPGIIEVHEIFAYDVFYKDGTVTVNKDSILNSPTVNFEL